MSRTYRNKPKTNKKIRDGADFRTSRACRHHGPCSYCSKGRQHTSRRRAPIEEYL